MYISEFSKVLLLEVSNSFLDYGMSVGRRCLVHPLHFNCEKIRISLDKGLEWGQGLTAGSVLDWNPRGSIQGLPAHNRVRNLTWYTAFSFLIFVRKPWIAPIRDIKPTPIFRSVNIFSFNLNYFVNAEITQGWTVTHWYNLKMLSLFQRNLL